MPPVKDDQNLLWGWAVLLVVAVTLVAMGANWLIEGITVFSPKNDCGALHLHR